MLIDGEQLDIDILPAGTKIREYVEGLISNLTESEKAKVDMRRVRTLQDLSDEFNVPGAYFVHGKPRKVMQSEQGTDINSAYIGLVLPRYGEKGELVGEDVIAISPVARQHAAYLYRHDVSQRGWQEVLAHDKTLAKQLGARPLKFTHIAGEDTFEQFKKKVKALFLCDPEEFSLRYSLQRKLGEYVLIPSVRRALGEVAIGGF
ncbi:hypothetical protein JNM87_01750 [Candidatus Saccharibacteria bacterium]|nr:hypothetical protein [Candidatus Saccharibacteria bacterium]